VLTFLFPVTDPLTAPPDVVEEVNLFEGISMKMCPPTLAFAAIAAA